MRHSGRKRGSATPLRGVSVRPGRPRLGKFSVGRVTDETLLTRLAVWRQTEVEESLLDAVISGADLEDLPRLVIELVIEALEQKSEIRVSKLKRVRSSPLDTKMFQGSVLRFRISDLLTGASILSLTMQPPPLCAKRNFLMNQPAARCVVSKNTDENLLTGVSPERF
jgi:hypothetical protein